MSSSKSQNSSENSPGPESTYAHTRYDAFGKLASEYKNGAWLKDFIYAGDRLLAMEDSGGRSYITQDHLGSTRVVTNSSGAIESRHDYQPFGKEIPSGYGGRTVALGYTSQQNPAQQNILQRSTGKELDPETGLQYFGARYYSGRQGRFTSADDSFADQDSNDPQSWNAYAYVRNNPLRSVDPNGEAAWDVFTGLVKGGANFAVNTIVSTVVAAGTIAADFGNPVPVNTAILLSEPIVNAVRGLFQEGRHRRGVPVQREMESERSPYV